jgi:hypothetical protein
MTKMTKIKVFYPFKPSCPQLCLALDFSSVNGTLRFCREP